MLLTALPCCAFDNCPEERQTAGISCDTDSHRGGDTDGCGTCSPFFNCHHCAGFNIAAKTTFFQHKPIEAPATKPVALEGRCILTAYVGNIWQPPRA